MEQAIFESVALKLKFNNNIFHIIGEDRLSGGLVLGTVGTLVTTIGIWSQRWEGGGGLVGAAGRQLVSCVLVQSLSKYSRVGQLGWTLTTSWHQPTLCHLGPATAGWHHSGIYNYRWLLPAVNAISRNFRNIRSGPVLVYYTVGVWTRWVHLKLWLVLCPSTKLIINHMQAVWLYIHHKDLCSGQSNAEFRWEL